MKKFLKVLGYTGVVVLILVNSACKSKNVLVGGEVKSDLRSQRIIDNHYDNDLEFKTMSGRVKINYSDGESSQGVTVSLRMKKDEVIWLSAPLSVIKIMITPDRVQFYNKLDNTYFDGDYSYLEELLGTKLNFQMVQNLLLGQAIIDLRDQKYYAATVSDQYQLKPIRQSDIYKTLFLLEPSNFKMTLQQISQPSALRMLSIMYKNYQKVSGKILPNQIEIKTTDKKHMNQIDIEYNNVVFDKALNFPFSIPSGFKPVELEAI
ncbi:DUF4292 domain-containing protein [Galbibacter sp.]|jgi:hypothetical protein|uniref:DUF4292 domain-containing protein n=1 Tax=Galbibacter sp. TaxID=2918471 RepID=UPI003A9284ED